MALTLDYSLPVEELDNYDFLETIGYGTQGHVMLAIHIPTGTKVALKIMSKRAYPTLDWLHMEINAMRALDHPNVLKLLNVIESEDTVWLVTEYASSGDLLQYIRSHQRLSEEEARPIFCQLLNAVQYCHENHIVHRDLKPDNILLDEHMNVKLADFGLAGTFSEENYLHRFCGTPTFSAPEIFLHKEYVGPEVDVWSLGAVLYHMIAGRPPFVGGNLKQLRMNITQGRYETPAFFSRKLRALLKKFFTLDAKLRPTLPELITDVWIQGKQAEDTSRKDTLSVSLEGTSNGTGLLTPERSRKSTVPSSLEVTKKGTGLLTSELSKQSRVPWSLEVSRNYTGFLSQETSRKSTGPATPLVSGQLSPSMRAPQHGLMGSMFTQSGSSNREKQGGGSSVQAGQPYGKTSHSPWEEGRGQKGLARRLGNLLLRICCVLPAGKICGRRRRLNKVVPVTQDS
nr:MAP/microtubule affinity-regulating kinase 3-like [Microcebus murinus]